jgi:hypothetical protein
MPLIPFRGGSRYSGIKGCLKSFNAATTPRCQSALQTYKNLTQFNRVVENNLQLKKPF